MTDDSSASLSSPTATRPRRRLCPTPLSTDPGKPTMQHTASLDDQLAHHGKSNAIIRFEEASAFSEWFWHSAQPPRSNPAFHRAPRTLRRGTVWLGSEKVQTNGMRLPCSVSHIRIRTTALLHCRSAAFQPLSLRPLAAADPCIHGRHRLPSAGVLLPGALRPVWTDSALARIAGMDPHE